MEKTLEITKLNYEAGIEELLSLVDSADFVAVDATIEATGLVLKNESWNFEKINLTDLLDPFGKWYDNIKSSERSNFLLEVGIAFFKRVPNSSSKLEVEAFNIPIFPACINDSDISRFRDPKGSLQGLDEQAQKFADSTLFDINKSLHFGAPFLNHELSQSARKYILEYPGFTVAATKQEMNPFLVQELVKEVTVEDRQLLLQRFKGVAKVFEKICDKGLTIVGHHMFLKVMWIYKDFFRFLPDTYPEYCVCQRQLFPRIYDTKYMATNLYHSNQLKRGVKDLMSNSTIYALIRALNSKEAVELRDPAQKTFEVIVSSRSVPYLDDLTDLVTGMMMELDPKSYCYVAGFDALLAGILFLDLIKLLEVSKAAVKTQVRNNGRGQLSIPKNVARGAEVNDVGAGGDLLHVFLRGGADVYVNKLFGEVDLSPIRGPIEMCPEVIQAKKMWFEKEQKRKDGQLLSKMVMFQDILFTP